MQLQVAVFSHYESRAKFRLKLTHAVSYYSVTLLYCTSCWFADAVFVSTLLHEVLIKHVVQKRFINNSVSPFLFID